MNTVFYHDFTADKSLINPTDLTKPIAGFPQVCISTYSKQIIDKFAAMKNVEIIANPARYKRTEKLRLYSR